MKRLLYMLIGAAIGAGITDIVVRKKYKAISDKEIADMKAFYEKNYTQKDTDNGNEDEKKPKEVQGSAEKPKEELTEDSLLDSAKDITAAKEKTVNYSAMFNGDDAPDEGTDDLDLSDEERAQLTEDLAANEHPTDSEDDKEPYILGYDSDPEMFNRGEFGVGRDTRTLTYYTKNGVLADDLEPLDRFDIDYTMGQQNLKDFLNADGESVCYIRNNRDGTDYEVIRDDETDYEVAMEDEYGSGWDSE